MSEEARKRDRQWGWALLILAGTCFIGAVSGYSVFDDLERTGGSFRTSRRVALFYETFGKAGFPIVFGGAGLICGAVGVWKLAKSHDLSQRSKECEGGFGSSAENRGMGSRSAWGQMNRPDDFSSTAETRTETVDGPLSASEVATLDELRELDRQGVLRNPDYRKQLDDLERRSRIKGGN
jgi:hypothetical protein